MGIVEDLAGIGDSVRGAAHDVPSLVENILTGDVHGVMTDGRNIVGDVTGVAQGLQNLGVSFGEVPKRYLGNAAKLADSKILSAAQLVIEGEKALTGSGDPETGTGYEDSADHLEDAVITLISATPAADRWDGAASEAYEEANGAHRSRVSAMRTADAEIARILSKEADQIIETRRTLDDASRYLYDFGLATSWMNFVPPLIPVKTTVDLAAAAAALGWTTISMGDLVTTSLQSAADIWTAKGEYEKALGVIADDETELLPESALSGPCGTLITREDDLADRPSRLSESTHYEVPDIEREWGPPATPYVGPPSPSVPATPLAPAASSASGPAAPPALTPAGTPPASPASPPGAPYPPSRAPVAPTAAAPALRAPMSRGAAPGASGSERAPIEAAPTKERQTRTR